MESVDAVGIVFFAAYWTWFEQAFEGLLAVASGTTWGDMVESGLAVPVVHAEIDYLRPLRLSDQVTVEMQLVRTGRRSVDFEARFLEGGEPVAVARTVHVVTTRGGLAAADIPDWMLSAVEPRPPDAS